MSFRYEKNQNGEQDLVIDGFEKGIAPSPFMGIGNMRNLTIDYYQGIAYVNYKRLPCLLTNQGTDVRNVTITIASPAVFTANSHNLREGNTLYFTTSGSLPTGLSLNTPYYVISAGLTANDFEVSTSPGGSAINTSGTQSGTHQYHISMAAPAYKTQSPAGIIYFSDTLGIIFKQTAVNGNTFDILTGCPGTPNAGLEFWNNYLFAFSAFSINVCGTGAGDAGILSNQWNTAAASTGVWPIQTSGLTMTGTPAAGDTSATISTYTDAQGNARAFWNGPSGTYPMFVTLTSGSQTVYASLTQGSATVTWYPALNLAANNASSFSVRPMERTFLPQAGFIHPSLVSINDGNLYFGNDNAVGSFEVNPNQVFDKANMKTFAYNGAALGLPTNEQAIALTELRNQLLVGSFYKIYPWDRFSPQWLNPIPMPEKLSKMINILNNVYITAGNKGYVYISNGYNAQKFAKLPDNISGAVDPAWLWGGIMTHRQKLWVQALAVNSQSSANTIAGIFSINLDDGTINMESQNSFGLVASTTTQAGLLIDNNNITLNYDNYYSAWNSGAATVWGGIDYNDTTLWSGGESLIETDIIPIGTFAQNRTFISAEFKLDQPLRTGDAISLYARKSLSDSYVLLGTTTTALLSDFYEPLPFEQWQWVQFKVVLTANATATASSFNRLREIRIR